MQILLYIIRFFECLLRSQTTFMSNLNLNTIHYILCAQLKGIINSLCLWHTRENIFDAQEPGRMNKNNNKKKELKKSEAKSLNRAVSSGIVPCALCFIRVVLSAVCLSDWVHRKSQSQSAKCLG